MKMYSFHSLPLLLWSIRGNSGPKSTQNISRYPATFDTSAGSTKMCPYPF